MKEKEWLNLRRPKLTEEQINEILALRLSAKQRATFLGLLELKCTVTQLTKIKLSDIANSLVDPDRVDVVIRGIKDDRLLSLSKDTLSIIKLAYCGTTYLYEGDSNVPLSFPSILASLKQIAKKIELDDIHYSQFQEKVWVEEEEDE